MEPTDTPPVLRALAPLAVPAPATRPWHAPPLARSTARVPFVLSQRCTGCGQCVGACDLHLLSLQAVHWKKSAVLHDAHRCTGCSDCARTCPFRAIQMRTAPIKSPGQD